jgi:hypothetical protein
MGQKLFTIEKSSSIPILTARSIHHEHCIVHDGENVYLDCRVYLPLWIMDLPLPIGWNEANERNISTLGGLQKDYQEQTTDGEASPGCRTGQHPPAGASRTAMDVGWRGDSGMRGR